LAVVTPGVLLRCGQPHIRDLDVIRQQHGLRAIVCVRGGTRHPLRGRWFRRERAYCAQHGIRFEHIRMSDESTPPAEAFARFLAVVRDPAARPVLVHCEQGFHRTGLMCAAYRIAEEGWSLDRALAEMASHGFAFNDPRRQPLVQALRTWAAARSV
jgi:protein tyrosine/serine phosphatase